MYEPICDFSTIIVTAYGKPDLVKTREFGNPNSSAGNIELRKKIFKGAVTAYNNLVSTRAETDGQLVIEDSNDNILHVPAKELLKKLPEI